MFLDTWLLWLDHNIGDQNKWQIWDQGVYYGFDPLQTGRNHETHIRMKEISLLTCLSRDLALTAVQSSVLSLQHCTAQPSADWNGLHQLKTFSSVEQHKAYPTGGDWTQWSIWTQPGMPQPRSLGYLELPGSAGEKKEHGTHTYKLLQT